MTDTPKPKRPRGRPPSADPRRMWTVSLSQSERDQISKITGQASLTDAVRVLMRRARQKPRQEPQE